MVRHTSKKQAVALVRLKEVDMLKALALVSGLVMGIQTIVCAGVVFHVETTFPNRTEVPPKADAIMVDGKKLKMAMHDAGKTQSTVIYRGDREEILLINHGDHTWRAMDKATMINLGQHINPAMEQMQKRMGEALKNMPPEKRALMEKMFARQGVNPAMMAGKIEMQIKKTGETQTINGYPCVKYETRQEGNRVAEHWVTDWKRVPGNREAQKVFQDMAAFSKEVSQAAFKGSGGPASFFESIGEIEGYPVLTRIFSNGTIVTESRLTGVEEKSISAQEFDPPKDYVKKDFLPKNLSPHKGQ